MILAACQNGQALSRIGLVAGKKVGLAVKRNRARRLLREAARHLYGQLAPGWDIVLIARLATSRAAARDVYAALADTARRAGLLEMQQAVHDA